MLSRERRGYMKAQVKPKLILCLDDLISLVFVCAISFGFSRIIFLFGHWSFLFCFGLWVDVILSILAFQVFVEMPQWEYVQLRIGLQ